MPIAITNTLVNGNVVDAPQLNTNFQDLAQPLNGTEDMDIIIAHTDAVEAPLTVNQKGTGPITILMQNSVAKVTVENSGQIDSTVVTGTPPIDVDSITKCPNLNADLLDDLEAAAFAKLDTHRAYFSFPIGFEADPTITTLSTEDRQVWVAPPNAVEMKITRLWIKWTAGSRTAGNTLTYTIRRRPANGVGFTDIGSISLDNTNNTIHVVYYNDIADFTLTAGDTITFFKAAIGAGQTEKAVTIGVEGYQKLST